MTTSSSRGSAVAPTGTSIRWGRPAPNPALFLWSRAPGKRTTFWRSIRGSMLLLFYLGDEVAGVPFTAFKAPDVHCLLKSLPRSRNNLTFANHCCTFLWYKGIFMLGYGIEGSWIYLRSCTWGCFSSSMEKCFMEDGRKYRHRYICI